MVRIFLAGTIAVLGLFSGVAEEATTPAERLAAHGAGFVREVVEVTQGVHVAVGFGLPNCVLIVGDGGDIIVDTMESTRAAEEVRAAFDAVSTQPVKAIIYTHSHYDHMNGATVFAAESSPEVIAHAKLDAEVRHRENVVQTAIFSRSMRQFGIPLPPKDFVNAGIGPRLNLGMPGASGYIPPTKTFDDVLELELAGVKLKLVHAPGETDDQIYVYLPEQRVLLAGDNIYKSFPNLYAIRGTKPRDVAQWVASLDKMLAENAAYLVPGHTEVVAGEEKIRALLQDYRDAIAHVLNETVRGINNGESPDEMAVRVQLPERFHGHPYLQEYYGTVPWSVRAIYSAYMGWFDGNATNLFPLPPKERAARMAKLAGGQDKLLAQVESALTEEDWQWAAELADHVLALEKNNAQAKKFKARALAELAQRQTSANARNYYLTSALQLGGY